MDFNYEKLVKNFGMSDFFNDCYEARISERQIMKKIFDILEHEQDEVKKSGFDISRQDLTDAMDVLIKELDLDVNEPCDNCKEDLMYQAIKYGTAKDVEMLFKNGYVSSNYPIFRTAYSYLNDTVPEYYAKDILFKSYGQNYIKCQEMYEEDEPWRDVRRKQEERIKIVTEKENKHLFEKNKLAYRFIYSIIKSSDVVVFNNEKAENKLKKRLMKINATEEEIKSILKYCYGDLGASRKVKAICDKLLESERIKIKEEKEQTEEMPVSKDTQNANEQTSENKENAKNSEQNITSEQVEEKSANKDTQTANEQILENKENAKNSEQNKTLEQVEEVSANKDTQNASEQTLENKESAKNSEQNKTLEQVEEELVSKDTQNANDQISENKESAKNSKQNKTLEQVEEVSVNRYTQSEGVTYFNNWREYYEYTQTANEQTSKNKESAKNSEQNITSEQVEEESANKDTQIANEQTSENKEDTKNLEENKTQKQTDEVSANRYTQSEGVTYFNNWREYYKYTQTANKQASENKESSKNSEQNITPEQVEEQSANKDTQTANEQKFENKESAKNSKHNITTEQVEEVSASQDTQSAGEQVSENKEDIKSLEENKTLRQKYDVSTEQGLNNLLSAYAQVNQNYYNGQQKRTPEDVRKRRNVNAQMKRILQNKLNNEKDLETGMDLNSYINNNFSNNLIEEVSKSKEATLELFYIMSSGVYVKDGKRIRLTQKQRQSLAVVLEKVSEKRLESDFPQKVAKSNVKGKTKEINKALGED